MRSLGDCFLRVCFLCLPALLYLLTTQAKQQAHGHTHRGRLLILVSLDLSPRVLNLKGVKEDTDIMTNTHITHKYYVITLNKLLFSCFVINVCILKTIQGL